MSTTILHCRMKPEFMRRVREQAAVEQRTITAIVVRAMERYLEEAKHEAA